MLDKARKYPVFRTALWLLCINRMVLFYQLVNISIVLYQKTFHCRGAVDGRLRNWEKSLFNITVGLLGPCTLIFSKTNHIGTALVFPVELKPTLPVKDIQRHFC